MREKESAYVRKRERKRECVFEREKGRKKVQEWERGRMREHGDNGFIPLILSHSFDVSLYS